MNREFLRHQKSILLSCFITLVLLVFSGKNSFAQLPDELHITMVQDAMNSDEIVIIFYEDGSAGYDDYDGLKFPNPTINLSSLSEEEYEMAINVYSPLTETETIPLSINSNTDGNFSLNFSGMSSFGSISGLTLYDAFTDQTIDVIDNPLYAFSIDNNNASTFGASRFSVTFTVSTSERSINTLVPVKISKATVNTNSRKGKVAVETAEVKAYPNPCKEVLNISLNENYSSGADINITDMTGRVMFSSEVSKDQYMETLRPDISLMSPGMYFIHIASKDGQNKEKILFTKMN